MICSLLGFGLIPINTHPTNPPCVTAEPISDAALAAQSREIAQRFGLPWEQALSPDRPGLVLSHGGLAWHQPTRDAKPSSGKPVMSQLDRFDVDSPAARSLRQPIAKAVGLARRPRRELLVLDATGGWAEDAYLLTALGCRVWAVERNPIVAALVSDGLRRAAVAHRQVTARLDYQWSTGQSLLSAKRSDPVDVVYLDPMFPDDPRRTALAKKPLRLLRDWVGDDADAGELFELAVAMGPKRIVVKRPIQAPPIHPKACQPTIVFQGRGFRFDVYVSASQ